MKRLLDVAPFTVFDRTFSYQRFSHIAVGLCYFPSFDAMLEIIMAVLLA
jgi:hypothetical protein